MAWQDGSFVANSGVNVGSSNSQDLFIGYGTEFNNPDRFILDISPIIHMLGADQTKLISWLQGTGTEATREVSFTHMEDELMTVRDFKAKVVRTVVNGTTFYMLALDKPQDWQAIEVAAAGDGPWVDKELPQIYMSITKADGTVESAVIRTPALNGTSQRDIKADSGAAGLTSVKDQIILGTTVGGTFSLGGSAAIVGSGNEEVGDVPAGAGLSSINPATWTTTASVTVNVVTPVDHLKGMAQGSGLPNETRKKSRSLTNFVQIFKTPLTITNTLKEIAMRGGSELGMRRLRKAIQHKTSIEYAMMFQGGGDVGVDYGIIGSTSENPLTRFKGLGVGLAATGQIAKPGWITTKNADYGPNKASYILSRSSTTIANLHAFLADIFDDLVDDPSETKIMLASNSWLIALANWGGSFASGFSMGDHTVTNALGIPNIKTLTSPVGTLRLIPFKHFRGRFEDYAVILDMKNIKYRPLRPTRLLSDVGTPEVDGQLDYFITEAGLQVLHESTHAVVKLSA